MNPEINYLAVLVASIVNMVVGFLWYGPLFGKVWMPLAGHTPESIEQGKRKGMGPTYIIALVGAFLMAYVFAHVLGTYQAETLSAGFQGAFWMWLGFIAVVELGKVLWYGKTWKLWCIESGYWLVVLLINSAILVSWK